MICAYAGCLPYLRSEMKNILIIVFALCLTACGSTNGSRYQHIAVSTFYNDQQIDDVDCTLTNKKGSWKIISQGATTIQRGYSDLNIICEKENIPSGLVTVKSSMNSLLPSFIVGGAIGSTFDATSQSIFEYPSYVAVYMGRQTSIPLEKSAEKTE